MKDRDEMLLGGPVPAFDADSALARFRARQHARASVARPAWMRPALVAAGVVLAAAVAGASGVADTVIKVFEPQRVATVQVDPTELRGIPDPSEYGTLTWIARPSWHEVASATAAASEAGFAPLAPSALPSGVPADVRYAVMAQARATFRFDEAKAVAAAAKVSATIPPMPASIANTTLTMSGGPAVLQAYGAAPNVPADRAAWGGSPELLIVQAKAPVVTSDGAAVDELRDYALAQPGVPPSVAAQIRAIGDPVRTLLVPVGLDPTKARTITLRGTQGYLFSDGTGIGTAVVWLERGYVIGVLSSLDEATLVSLVNGLR